MFKKKIVLPDHLKETMIKGAEITLADAKKKIELCHDLAGLAEKFSGQKLDKEAEGMIAKLENSVVEFQLVRDWLVQELRK